MAATGITFRLQRALALGVAAALGAAALLAPGGNGAARGAVKRRSPECLRLVITPKSTVYLQFEDRVMHMATTAADLSKAKAVWAVKSSPLLNLFPPVDLPVPAAQLPGGWSKARATFSTLRLPVQKKGGSGGTKWSAAAVLSLYREDAKKVVWIYDLGMKSETGPEAEKAPALPFPTDGALGLEVFAQLEKTGEVGIVVRAKAGKWEVHDIRRNGKSVQAEMKVVDAKGKVLATTTAPLERFSLG